MVNMNGDLSGMNPMPLRSSVLRMLREHQGTLSGQTIAARLSVSRVAVWKQVGVLREQGYRIESSPSGYTLLDQGDLLLPWEIAPAGAGLRLLRRVASTMDVAREEAEAASETQAPEGSRDLLVIADEQERGRGRRGRTWISPRGGLYLTYLLHPRASLTEGWMYQTAAALALARVLRDRFRIPARLKWPNDLLVDERKIAGVLTEIRGEGSEIRWISVGLGVNVNVPVGMEGTTSISALLGKDIARKDLVEAWLGEMDRRLLRLPDESPRAEWVSLCCTLGRRVIVRAGEREVRGFAEGIGSHGELLLRDGSGSTGRIAAGDCLHENDR